MYQLFKTNLDALDLGDKIEHTKQKLNISLDILFSLGKVCSSMNHSRG